MLVYLVQPDDALADALLDECRGSGWTFERIVDPQPDALRTLGEDRPDAVVVDLDGRPDAALTLTADISARRRLRGVPLVFCGGTQAALSRAQETYPRASFARRDVLLTVLASLRA